MKKLITTSLLAFNMFVLFGQQMSPESQKSVSDFINSIKNKKGSDLGFEIEFPFEREYPIPAIKTKEEFVKRYSEVFDDSLTKMIVHSDPAKDWSAMGWRGIMLFNGVVWLEDGRSANTIPGRKNDKEIKFKWNNFRKGFFRNK